MVWYIHMIWYTLLYIQYIYKHNCTYIQTHLCTYIYINTCMHICIHTYPGVRCHVLTSDDGHDVYALSLDLHMKTMDYEGSGPSNTYILTDTIIVLIIVTATILSSTVCSTVYIYISSYHYIINIYIY